MHNAPSWSSSVRSRLPWRVDGSNRASSTSSSGTHQGPFRSGPIPLRCFFLAGGEIVIQCQPRQASPLAHKQHKARQMEAGDKDTVSSRTTSPQPKTTVKTKAPGQSRRIALPSYAESTGQSAADKETRDATGIITEHC
jgi:hypothetical protein